MRRATPYLLLLLAVVLVYIPTLRNGWVWDDTALVLRDPLIRSPRLLMEGFRHFLFLDATAADFYRPLQRVLYTFDYTLGGFTPWIFHLSSLLVHAGAALAFYAFGKRWLASAPLAFAAAMLWAIHPVHSSAIAYIAGVADPLAALLGFGGLALLLKNRWTAAGICFGAALFAKESGAAFLVIGLGFAWEWTRNQKSDLRWPQLARVAIPMLALAITCLALRSTAEKTPPPPPSKPISLSERPVLALRAVAEYTGLLAAPVNLRMERDVREPSPWNGSKTVAGGILLLGIAAWFWKAERRTRACLLAAGAAYLPVSNLLALNATAAEHWVYVPSAFLFLAAANSMQGILSNPRWLTTALVFGGIWVAALGVRTAVRCRDWRDQETFLQATIHSDKNGGSSRMLGNLALLKLSCHETEAAVVGFQAALLKQSDQPFAMLGLARALTEQGKFTEARPWLARCESQEIVHAAALSLQAELELRETGQNPLPLLHEAAAVNPRFWPMRKRYITMLMERGELETALRELREILALQSFRAETWEALGDAFTKIGQPELAQTAYTEANLRDVWRKHR